ncbi:MAG: type VI secretion system baseplate subunit TssG [Vicinamibacterales bacterium]
MDAALGRETDAVAFLTALADAPYRYDFYQALRRLECLHGDKPRWGCALRPVDEPVRLGQEPDLSFAPAPLASFEPGTGGAPPRLQVRLFGLLGPNGPLPIHITEYVRERVRNAGDPTLSRFLDLLHHRFLALFYRAWAQAQPHVNHDRRDDDHFASYVGAFIGLSPAPVRGRNAVPDLAKFFHAGALIRQVRNAEGLVSIVEHFFRVPARVEQFVGHWMRLGGQERTYLKRDGAMLGAGAVLGARVWDRQHRFRIHLGPLTLAQYESFLPGGRPLRKLVDWVRQYLCFELDWDLRLVLKKDEVPPFRLGAAGRLGWTAWLGRRQEITDAGDLRLDAEAFVERVGVGAA